MNKLPLDIADMICEKVPLEYCLNIIDLNGRFKAATTRQFKKRATYFNVSFVHRVRDQRQFRNMTEHILPLIRTMVVDVPQNHNVRLCI